MFDWHSVQREYKYSHSFNAKKTGLILAHDRLFHQIGNIHNYKHLHTSQMSRNGLACRAFFCVFIHDFSWFFLNRAFNRDLFH